MLKLDVPAIEGFDNSTNTFTSISPAVTLQLEHSLLSLSKWEAKWHKPFLSRTEEKTREEICDYIRCMTLNSSVPLEVYQNLTPQLINQVIAYIDEPMTATTFSSNEQNKSREIITSEIIYYWMVSFNIPFECQKWHLNRLLTLIRVCSIKNAPQKKMSAKEIMARNKALNAQRRAKFNTRG